jgi:group I intron endonuclease
MAIIYKVTNKLTGKIYIGKSKYNREDYFGSGLKINYALKKYGIENFTKEIIQECSDDEVDLVESFWIEELNSCNDEVGYNIAGGGQGGDHYWKVMTHKQKKEHRQKIRNGVATRKRSPHSEETKKKMSLNQNQTPEIKEKRAHARRKPYIIFDHCEQVVYTTDNLIEFCNTNNVPNVDRMRHNERNKKTIIDGRWSCRKLDDYSNATIQDIEKEVKLNTLKYKQQMIKSRRNNAQVYH